MVTLNINVGRKEAAFFVAFFVMVVGIGGVIAYVDIPNPGHGADEIAVTVNGTEVSLQGAITILENKILVLDGMGPLPGDVVGSITVSPYSYETRQCGGQGGQCWTHTTNTFQCTLAWGTAVCNKDIGSGIYAFCQGGSVPGDSPYECVIPPS
jgi:hypothetical protein